MNILERFYVLCDACHVETYAGGLGPEGDAVHLGDGVVVCVWCHTDFIAQTT